MNTELKALVHAQNNTGDNDFSGAIKMLEDIREDAKSCKARHFYAASRKRHWSVFFGIGTIVSTAFILLCARLFPVLDGSQLTSNIVIKDLLGFGTMFFAVITGLFAALQLFFKYDRAIEGHMSVANRYVGINRNCKNLIARIQDNEVDEINVIWSEIRSITTEYLSINSSAESYHTSKKDWENAKKDLDQNNEVIS